MNIADRPFATKSEWVYEQLRRRILGGGYKPDDRLRLTELAREFNMSEMPVREALRMLQRDGLIEMHSHRGASVANLSWSRAAEIVSVRMHLEVMAVREAAKGHDKSSLADLTKILDRMDRDLAAGAAARFSTGNREFHRRLYETGPNRSSRWTARAWRQPKPSTARSSRRLPGATARPRPRPPFAIATAPSIPGRRSCDGASRHPRIEPGTFRSPAVILARRQNEAGHAGQDRRHHRRHLRHRRGGCHTSRAPGRAASARRPRSPPRREGSGAPEKRCAGGGAWRLSGRPLTTLGDEAG